jgi:hypothetical protein
VGVKFTPFLKPTKMDFDRFFNNWTSTMEIDNLEAMYVEQLSDEEILKANHESLLRGEIPNAGFTDPYSFLTLQIKNETGGFISPSGLIAFRDTGAFWSSMFVAKNGNEAFIDAVDDKTDMLTAEWGDEILGVPDENKPEIVKEAEPRFYDEVNKKLWS